MLVGAHYGISSDASTSIGLIALSRLMRTRDATTLAQRAATPYGQALLGAILATILRVATTTIDRGLSEANMVTLANLPGSSLKYESQYGNFGSLQSRLPWPQFRLLVSAVFESINEARRREVGFNAGQFLMASTAGAPLDAAGQGAISALIAEIEPTMRVRLAAVTASSSSSSDSSPRTTPLPQPSSPPSRSPQAPSIQPLAQAALSLDATSSLLANLERVVERRVARSLSSAEAATLVSAFEEGLSVLQMGGAVARRQLLSSMVLVALVNQGAAWLWASVLEATERPATSVAALASSIVESCSTTAAMLFADAAVDFATEGSAK